MAAAEGDGMTDRGGLSEQTLASIREMFGSGNTDREIGDTLGFSWHWIRNIRSKLGLHRERKSPQRPPQFTEDAHLLNRDLCRIYGVGPKVIIRWRKEIGVVVHTNQFTFAPRNAKRTSRGLLNSATSSNKPLSHTNPVAKDTISARAQRHLQRCGYIPVVALSVLQSKADPNMWLVGARKMTSGEMIDLAEEKGFEPEAWREVAA